MTEPHSPDLEALSHPSEAEKRREQRLYFVLRRDLAPARGTLCRLAAQATWLTLARAKETTPERYNAYSLAAQPKIALRARDRKTMERAIAAVSGLPHALIRACDGSGLLLGIGPAARDELPGFVDRLQMLSDDTAHAQADGPAPAPQDTSLWLFVRKDAGIPYGKLVAQAGHGAFGAIARTLDRDPPEIARWVDVGLPVVVKEVTDRVALEGAHHTAAAAGLAAAFIVDAGRTVFSEPTPTVVGVGPCRTDQIPAALAAFPDLL